MHAPIEVAAVAAVAALAAATPPAHVPDTPAAHVADTPPKIAEESDRPRVEAVPVTAKESRPPLPDLPPVALTLPPGTDLVLVETSHKIDYVPEPDAPAGPRRARRTRVELVDEPLQIVETRKDQPPAP